MSTNGYISIKQSFALGGQVSLYGAKNAVLPIMSSLILCKGESVLSNVPNSEDVRQMISLLSDLGAEIFFDDAKKEVRVNTVGIKKHEVKPEVMRKMRASILVMGSLLSRFDSARVAMPGGCLIGSRPIDLHLQGFRKLGVNFEESNGILSATLSRKNLEKNRRIILEYPSVGATENLVMLAASLEGETTIVNISMEPEVLDFLNVLRKMGAQIDMVVPATLKIRGISAFNTIAHEIVPDRLEAGVLLLAAAITGGEIEITNAIPSHMDVFLEKLVNMGHEVKFSSNYRGVALRAIDNPKSASFKTGPYPGFPTDLQAPMMVAQAVSNGESVSDETVYENRFMHVKELEKMGAQISTNISKAFVKGVDKLYGTNVIATDIRASAALVLAGLVANGETRVFGIHHWRRGYDCLENKLKLLGANIGVCLKSK